MRTPLTPAQQELVLKFMPLARSLSRPFQRSWPARADEFYSEALLALVEAAQSFDPSRNVKFGTFMRYRVYGALRDTQRMLMSVPGWGRKGADTPSIQSLDADPDVEQHGQVLNVVLEDPPEMELEISDALEVYFQTLPHRLALICRLHYIQRLSLVEIAARLGRSKTRIAFLHRKAIEQLTQCVTDRLRAG